MTGLISKFATVGGASMASRVLGFAREALLAAVLGTGPVADVFYTCFRFPNLFRRLFAEGAFNIAFVPLFAKQLEGGGDAAARKFAQEIFAVLASWLLVFTAVALMFMPFLVANIVAPGFVDTPEKFELSVTMTRIMFPYLFCMSLVAMFSGILNSLRRYFLAAIVPVLLNVILISVLVMAIQLEWGDRQTGLALAWGVFVSGFGQLICLIWGCMACGYGVSAGPAAHVCTGAAPVGSYGTGPADRGCVADQSADRNNHCYGPGWGQRIAELCRQAESAAAWCYWHCGGCGAAAGTVPRSQGW